MDIGKYKEKKLQSKVELKNQRPMCFECHRPQKACFCHVVRPFDTNFEFRILMHPKEARKIYIGTGRLTNFALIKSEIIIGENFDNDEEVQALLNSDQYSPFLLYPGENSINVTTQKLDPEIFAGRTPILFILDATWSSAKSMMRDSKTLHDIPRISFDSSIQSKFTIKHQPQKYCLSTIESVYQLLTELDKQGLENTGDKKENLLVVLKSMVDFHIKCSSDPSMQSYKRYSNPYKSQGERKTSKKWSSRLVCYEGENYKGPKRNSQA